MPFTDGILDVNAATYHRDDLGDDTPSLSSGCASLLLNRSPRHAWYSHPKLNPDWQERHDPKFDLGTVAHQVLLEGHANIVVVEANDWRTKAAKDTRELANEAGLTAILQADFEGVLAMANACAEQLKGCGLDPIPFTAGKPEVPITWMEPNGARCRALIDWYHDNGWVSDFKTTRATAKPEAWARQILYAIGADVQVAFYSRGLLALTGYYPVWTYVVQEVSPPYELSLIRLSDDAFDVAENKVQAAIEMWANCLETNLWPGYGLDVFEADPPPWERERWGISAELEEMAWETM